MNDLEFHDKVITTLAELKTSIDNMNKQLLDGSNAAIPDLRNRTEANAKAITALEKTQAVTAWKLGSVSAFGGALFYSIARWVEFKLLR